MNNLRKKLKYTLKNCAFLGFTILFVSLGWGCGSTQKTTTTKTTVTYPNEYEVDEREQTTTTVSTSGDQQNRGLIEENETTTSTEIKNENRGILSSTFHAIGYVISIPFRIVGGLFRIIFGG